MSNRKKHPESGQKGKQSRDSLFILLILTVGLAVIINVLTGFLIIPDTWYHSRGWIIVFVFLLVFVVYLSLKTIKRDDEYIGKNETDIDLFLAYRLSANSNRVNIVERTSYSVSNAANRAWKSCWSSSGFEMSDLEKGFFENVLPQHFELIRYLLFRYLNRFEKSNREYKEIKGITNPVVETRQLPREEWPEILLNNPFIVSSKKENLSIPEGSVLTVYDVGSGNVLMDIKWVPQKWRWMENVWLINKWKPGAVLSFVWLGPVDLVKPYDRKYEEMTRRLTNQYGDLDDPLKGVYVLNTRLKIVLESRWNFLKVIEPFQDWALNLVNLLYQKMDYDYWWEYLTERTTVDLDWKIGWMGKDEPSIIKRLNYLEAKLRRIEDKLFPDENPQGGDENNWLSGLQ